ncbi:MAG: hypothetical protein K2K25_07050 [Muribaculaceae bacterium]|nr:hypothetical protein [Muribaculaceae bacterium]
MKKFLLSRIFLAVGMLLLGYSAVWANQTQLVITTNSGTEAKFYVADSPVITYQENLLVVKDANQSISVEAADVLSFDFVSVGSGVDAIGIDGPSLSGLKPGTPVDVYTFDGQKVASFKADDSNSVSVQMNDLAPGLYIICTPDTSFKIKKN